MENKKITEFVHVDESNEEKISTKITIQSFENEIQEITNSFINKVDSLINTKEKEILTV